jgi:DNA helicase HerA-like ATPase
VSTDPAEFGTRIAQAYATAGKAVSLGKGMLGGTVVTDAVVQLPASMCNRHGLIAGATGTGKTKMLQLMAEQLTAMGVPVFTADVKGDLSGLLKSGEANDRVSSRASELGIEWAPQGNPVSFLSLEGLGPGVPVRAAVSSFGLQLLAKVLGANDSQASSLSLVFDYADKAGLALVDLDELRAVLQFLTSADGKAELQGIGGLSSATAGVLLRKIVELDQQGAEAFFGEPELDTADLMKVTPDGKGVISCLELAAVQDKPRIFSTFLMWLLAAVPDAPRDRRRRATQALLLLQRGPPPLRGRAEGVRRPGRADGAPDPLEGRGRLLRDAAARRRPGDVVAQLGNRVQHALRAFTPRDAKALKAAVSTYPKTADDDLEEDLTELGTGEAMVTILSERGADARRVDPTASAVVAHGGAAGRDGRRRAEGQPVVGRVRRGDPPGVRAGEAHREARRRGRARSGAGTAACPHVEGRRPSRPHEGPTESEGGRR